MEWSFEWEERFLLFLQEHMRSAWLDRVMNRITRLGDAGLLAICVCLVFLCIPALRWAGGLCTVSLLLNTLIVNIILKNLVGRVRPYIAIEGLVPIARLPSDASFPSGHTGACFAVAGVLLWLSFYPMKARGTDKNIQNPQKPQKPHTEIPKAAGILAVVIASLIGFSRLYLGVHYPTDVFAGAAIGLCTSFLTVSLKKKQEQEPQKLP